MAFGGTRVTPLDPLAVYPAVPETQLAEVRSDADVSPRERALAPIDADVLGLGHLPAGVNAAAEKTTATRHRWRVVETTTTPDPAVLDDTFASLVRDVRDVLDTTLHTRDVFRGLSTALSEVEVLPSPSEINTPLCARHVRFVETFPVFDLDSQKRTPVWDFETKTWTRDTFPGLHPRAREDVFALERWLESSVGDAVNGDENESDENDANDENDVNDADAKADDANFKSHENTKGSSRLFQMPNSRRSDCLPIRTDTFLPAKPAKRQSASSRSGGSARLRVRDAGETRRRGVQGPGRVDAAGVQTHQNAVDAANGNGHSAGHGARGFSKKQSE